MGKNDKDNDKQKKSGTSSKNTNSESNDNNELKELIKECKAKIDELENKIDSKNQLEKSDIENLIEEYFSKHGLSQLQSNFENFESSNSEIKNELTDIKKSVSEIINIKSNLDNLQSNFEKFKLNNSAIQNKIKEEINSETHKLISNMKGENNMCIKNIVELFTDKQNYLVKNQKAIENNQTAIVDSIQHQLVENINGVNSKLIEQNTNLKSYVDEKFSTLKNEQSEILNLLRIDLQNARNETKAISIELTKTSSSLQNQIQATNTLKGELSEEKNKYANECEKSNKLSQAYTAIQSEYKAIQNKYESFEPFMQDYKNIFTVALKCPSLEKLFSEIDKSLNTKSMLEFLLIFGAETNFASKVYSIMREEKKNTREEFNQNERALIEMLNTFYKQNSIIDFDIFEVIETEDGKTKFDKTKMQDIDRPADSSFRNATTVYVPALRKSSDTIAFKAIVQGEK